MGPAPLSMLRTVRPALGYSWRRKPAPKAPSMYRAGVSRSVLRSRAASARTWARRRCASTSGEGLVELGNQVLDILDAHREPHQAAGDAQARAHVLGQRRMRHDRRMLDQALHAAQA